MSEDVSCCRTAWSIVGASVTGSGHVQRNEPGQDRMAWQVWADCNGLSSLCVVVCADGAGSARKSWAGAWAACRSLIGTIDSTMKTPAGHARLTGPEGWTNGQVQALFRRARQHVMRWSAALNATPADLSTTLNMAVLGRDFGCFAQVGDGLIAYQAGQELPGWQLATMPDIGEFAGETTFLTSQNWADRLAVRLVSQPIEKVCLSTDGLAPILFQAQQSTIHGPFLDPLWAGLHRLVMTDLQKSQALATFLKSPRVTSRCDDDLTLILAGNQV